MYPFEFLAAARRGLDEGELETGGGEDWIHFDCDFAGELVFN
jgi:hypothetical protein